MATGVDICTRQILSLSRPVQGLLLVLLLLPTQKGMRKSSRLRVLFFGMASSAGMATSAGICTRWILFLFLVGLFLCRCHRRLHPQSQFLSQHPRGLFLFLVRPRPPQGPPRGNGSNTGSTSITSTATAGSTLPSMSPGLALTLSNSETHARWLVPRCRSTLCTLRTRFIH